MDDIGSNDIQDLKQVTPRIHNNPINNNPNPTIYNNQPNSHDKNVYNSNSDNTGNKSYERAENGKNEGKPQHKLNAFKKKKNEFQLLPETDDQEVMNANQNHHPNPSVQKQRKNNNDIQIGDLNVPKQDFNTVDTDMDEPNPEALVISQSEVDINKVQE
eukprot:CAMPEP_0116978220 /NCGR_PEP_ID=MMETSP0467-20121206/57644_1 /TAXON_ID=283647 /ORGANISM="Mesodinium pulex, Strain SPMC105" /LENGTH=158 /DNA_ID=CAMNT_0004671533 /DNA_START=1372 /DNA_END=1848 /DNA_ORIENTATION=+